MPEPEAMPEPEPVDEPAPVEEIAPVAAPQAETAGEAKATSSFKPRMAVSRAARALEGRTVDAVSEPTPKDAAPKEEQVNEDGVPLHPDGTPKTKRIYRGVVFYE